MASLPIPADTYFSDFKVDLIEYSVMRDGAHVITAKGLTNSNKKGNYVAFPIAAKLQVGDILQSKQQRFLVKSIEYDSYKGEDQIINAYY